MNLWRPRGCRHCKRPSSASFPVKHREPFLHISPVFLFLPFACFMLACSTTEEPPAQDGFGVIESTPDGEIVGEGDRVCDDNRDCRVVDGSCCSCGQNFTATLTAINAAALDEVEARRTTLCAERPCQNAGSQSPTCRAQGAACVDRRCELVGPLDAVLGDERCQ